MHLVEGDIVRKIQSRYLRDEQRYDKWGAQGKLLLVREVLGQEQRTLAQSTLLQLVNVAFPRTFSCQRADSLPRSKPEVIKEYYDDVRFSLSILGMSRSVAERLALEEAAETFCLSVDVIRPLALPG